MPQLGRVNMTDPSNECAVLKRIKQLVFKSYVRKL
jgi:hypothetical protein